MSVPNVPNWHNQIALSVLPCAYNELGMLTSTNRGGFTMRNPLPLPMYVPSSMTYDIQNAHLNVKALRRDGKKAVPVSPLAYLTKGYPGPYN
jgi:hypothetical protein